MKLRPEVWLFWVRLRWMTDKTGMAEYGLSSFYLKIIAVVTMLVDHIGMVFFSGEVAWRIVGRISFPIYCFLLVEGFYHTSNIKKYIRRLLIFAAVSEIPFDMIISGKVVDFAHQNVMFTLLIGLITIYGIQVTWNPMVKSAILVAGALISVIMFTDYSAYGVVLIYMFYNYRDRRVVTYVALVAMSFAMNNIQGAASLAVIPLLLYNGSKGPKIGDSKICKYGFYLIYPLHMCLFAAFKIAEGRITW